MEILIILIGILGGYFITKKVVENREIESIISKKESEYNNIIRSKLVLVNNDLISEYDKKMSDLKLNIRKYFSVWSNNKNVIEFYNKTSDRYIENLKAYLPKEEA